MDLNEAAGKLFEEAEAVLRRITELYREAGEELPDFIDVTIQRNTLDGQTEVGISTGDVHQLQ